MMLRSDAKHADHRSLLSLVPTGPLLDLVLALDARSAARLLSCSSSLHALATHHAGLKKTVLQRLSVAPGFCRGRTYLGNVGSALALLHSLARLRKKGPSLREFEIVAPHGSSLTCCIATVGQFVFTGSRDGEVKQWSLKDCSAVNTLSGHSSAVLCLAAGSGLLFSGSAGGIVKAWSLNTGTCVQTLPVFALFRRSPVFSLFLSRHDQGGEVLLAAGRRRVQVWSTSTWTCEHTISLDDTVTALHAAAPWVYLALCVHFPRERLCSWLLALRF